MSVSVRPLLAPGVAMVTAGAIALAPAVVAPPSEITAAPTVHVENIALTGIGQDIYYAITPWVQYGVSLVQYGVDWVPVIGPPISDQIGINYFAGIQPIVAGHCQLRGRRRCTTRWASFRSPRPTATRCSPSATTTSRRS